MCPKCFALLPAGSEFCPECGASVVEASEGSDGQVYSELARANLYRMRNSTKEAVEVCLGILRRYPNNVTAHTMLGDIYAEQDDLKQASEWYEMALDLSPGSVAEKAKLQKVRERMVQKEQATTAQSLGIPQRSSSVNLFVGGLVALILAIVGGAYFLGKGTGTATVKKEAPIETPVTLPPSINSGTKRVEPDPVLNPPPVTEIVSIAEDASLLTTLRGSATQIGLTYISAVSLPDHMGVIVTVKAEPSDSPLVKAAFAASEVFTALPPSKHVIVRVVQGGKIVLMGETTSESYLEVSKQTTKDMASDKWAAMVFPKPWTPQ